MGKSSSGIVCQIIIYHCTCVINDPDFAESAILCNGVHAESLSNLLCLAGH